MPLPTAHLEWGTETTEAALGNVFYWVLGCPRVGSPSLEEEHAGCPVEAGGQPQGVAISPLQWDRGPRPPWLLLLTCPWPHGPEGWLAGGGRGRGRCSQEMLQRGAAGPLLHAEAQRLHPALVAAAQRLGARPAEGAEHGQVGLRVALSLQEAG